MQDETYVSGPIGGKCSSRRVDQVIAELAGRQHGVVGRSQLRRVGLTDSAIESRLRRGSLLRLHRGAYAVGYWALTVEARWMAAVLAGGERSGAEPSHRGAALGAASTLRGRS